MRNYPLYDLNQSPLYRLPTRAKLAALLQISPTFLQSLIQNKTYRHFKTQPKYPSSSHPVLAHKARDIQQPVGGLHDAQKRLANYLSRVILPDYVHSARKGRTYRSNAQCHQGNGRAFRIDIRKFYLSIHDAYVLRFFKERLKCSVDVAHILTELTCYERYLPTGSPLSPIMSFLAYWPMFDELYDVAKSAQVVMTLYVDDIVMSGPMAKGTLIPVCKRIIKKYGLKAHKIAQFSQGETRVITGVAVDKSGLKLPNKRHRKIRALKEELEKSDNAVDQLTFGRALIGIFREASVLEPSFREKARVIEAQLKV